CDVSPPYVSWVLAVLILPWWKGKEIRDRVRLEGPPPLKDLLAQIAAKPPFRIPGTAVVLGRMHKGVPLALIQNLKHNHVLQEKVLLVAAEMTERPRVPDEERVEVTPIADFLTRVVLRYGFMEQPDIPKGLAVAAASGAIAPCDLSQVTYYTGHETIIPAGRQLGMVVWREALFAFMHHNAQRPGAYFNLP